MIPPLGSHILGCLRALSSTRPSLHVYLKPRVSPITASISQLKGAPAREFWRIVWEEGFAQKEWRVVGGEERELARGQTDFSGLVVLPLIDTASQS